MFRSLLLFFFISSCSSVELLKNDRFIETAIAPLFAKWERGSGELHTRSPNGYPVYAGTFTFPSKVHAHPTIRCDFIVPLRPNGTPLPTAGDMVALFPWPGRQWLRSDESAWDWARQYGFTVFTLNFLNHDKANPDDTDKYYIYPQSGSATAWTQAHMNILEILSLPIGNRLFAYGESAGGSAAQLYASAFPVRVEGLVVFSGRTFDFKAPYLGPTLLLHTSEDRVEENEDLVKRMRQDGASPIHYAYAPNWLNWKPGYGWAHTVSSAARSFAGSWVRGLAVMRLKTGKIAPYAEWDLVGQQRLPSRQICADAWANMIAEPTLGTLAAGEIAQATMSPGEGRAKGAVVWVDYRFGMSPNDLGIVARVFCERGYACTAIAGPSPARGFAEISRDTKRLPGPRHLIVIAPTAGETVWSTTTMFKSVTVVDPSSNAVPDVIASLNRVAASSMVCSTDAPSGATGKIVWKVKPKTQNGRQWFVEVMNVLLERFE